MISSNISEIATIVVVGLSLVGLGIAFYQQISTLSNNLEDISNSLETVEQDVQKVDLKGMEKAVLRLAWDSETAHTGQNSVTHHLEMSEMDVTVSLASERPSSSIYKTLENSAAPGIDRSDMTVLNFEFSDRVNTRSVVSKINTDQEIANLEEEIFGHEGIFSSTSPYEFIYVTAKADWDELADFTIYILEKIDKYNVEFEDESLQFDRALEERLDKSDNSD